jgi:hypothetical protein
MILILEEGNSYDCFTKIYIYNFLKFKLQYLIISAETEKCIVFVIKSLNFLVPHEIRKGYRSMTHGALELLELLGLLKCLELMEHFEIINLNNHSR